MIQDEFFYVVREGVVVVLDVDECRISAVLTGATDVHLTYFGLDTVRAQVARENIINLLLSPSVNCGARGV